MYKENIATLKAFLIERENIRLKKEAGEPRPWTTDPILATKSFCNMQRENDRGTKWLATNWREPHKDDPDFWFAAAVYRRGMNKEATAEFLGYPVPWTPAMGDRYEEAVATFGYSKAYRTCDCFVLVTELRDSDQCRIMSNKPDIPRKEIDFMVDCAWAELQVRIVMN